jgi:tRNA threonylcarbamoyladenosine biosynthesis protein TsaE
MSRLDFDGIKNDFDGTQVDLDGISELGLRLALAASPGTLIALSGDLGAGKTTLSKAIAKGLGVTEGVTSPTFTIINEYNSGRIPFYHFDVYRLEGIADEADEVAELGFDDYFYGKGLCVVEWAEIIGSAIPDDAVWINLLYGDDDDKRRIVFGRCERGLDKPIV